MNRPTLRETLTLTLTLTRSASLRAPDDKDRQVGQQIRRLRLLRRLTLTKVAAQAGISHQQLQRYEDGTNRISMGRLCSLAEVLDVPVTRLLSEDDRPEHPPRPASPSPSRQEELLRHVAAMAPPFQQAVLRLAKALAADKPEPLDTRSSAAADPAAAMPAPEPLAASRQGSPVRAAGSAGAAAALPRGRQQLQQRPLDCP